MRTRGRKRLVGYEKGSETVMAEPVKLKTAAAYIRVSTEDQVEYSPDAQLAEIRKYAAREGYLLPAEYIFVDEGISGRGTARRGAFNRMIGTAKQKPKPFDAILLWKFSRFARNREDSVVYKSMLRRQLGIEVVSVSEPVGDDKMSVLIEALIEAMDEYYSINLAEEVKRGMTEKARRGELQNAAPFGYRAEQNVLTPQPEEAALVREIFERFAGGEGSYQLAKWLNAAGVRTLRGNAFTNRNVEYILRNPVYIGKLRWNPAGRSGRHFQEETVILADAQHEPLIGAALWERVQRRLDTQKATARYKAKPSSTLKDWPSGLVRCAACGGTLIFVKPHYYKCNGYMKGACTHSQHITSALLKETIIERLEEDAANFDPISYVVVNSREENRQIKTLKTQESDLRRRLERLREAYLAGIEPLEEYKAGRERLEARLAEVQAELARCDAPVTPGAATQRLMNEIAAALDVLRSDAPVETKHDAVNAVVERCTWDRDANYLELVYRVVL